MSSDAAADFHQMSIPDSLFRQHHHHLPAIKPRTMSPLWCLFTTSKTAPSGAWKQMRLPSRSQTAAVLFESRYRLLNIAHGAPMHRSQLGFRRVSGDPAPAATKHATSGCGCRFDVESSRHTAYGRLPLKPRRRDISVAARTTHSPRNGISFFLICKTVPPRLTAAAMCPV